MEPDEYPNLSDDGQHMLELLIAAEVHSGYSGWRDCFVLRDLDGRYFEVVACEHVPHPDAANEDPPLAGTYAVRFNEVEPKAATVTATVSDN